MNDHTQYIRCVTARHPTLHIASLTARAAGLAANRASHGEAERAATCGEEKWERRGAGEEQEGKGLGNRLTQGDTHVFSSHEIEMIVGLLSRKKEKRRNLFLIVKESTRTLQICNEGISSNAR